MGSRGWRALARNPGASFAPLSPAPATRSIKVRSTEHRAARWVRTDERKNVGGHFLMWLRLQFAGEDEMIEFLPSIIPFTAKARPCCLSPAVRSPLLVCWAS